MCSQPNPICATIMGRKGCARDRNKGESPNSHPCGLKSAPSSVSAGNHGLAMMVAGQRDKELWREYDRDVLLPSMKHRPPVCSEVCQRVLHEPRKKVLCPPENVADRC